VEIIYKHNPLLNKVILNDTEKKLLFWKVVQSEFEDVIWSLKFRLESYLDNKLDPTQIGHEPLKKYTEEFLADPIRKTYEKLDSLAEEMIKIEYDENKIKYFIDALQEMHDGDCISQPCSCLKCHAEDMLDITSMPNYPGGIGLGLVYAFQTKDEFIGNKKTIDEAIDFLSNREYNEYETQEFYKPHINRWIERDKKAKE
jgi:hypothetical protein